VGQISSVPHDPRPHDAVRCGSAVQGGTLQRARRRLTGNIGTTQGAIASGAIGAVIGGAATAAAQGVLVAGPPGALFGAAVGALTYNYWNTSVPNGEPALPDGWTQQTDASNTIYYHNASTGESQWELPVDATSANDTQNDNGEQCTVCGHTGEQCECGWPIANTIGGIVGAFGAATVIGGVLAGATSSRVIPPDFSFKLPELPKHNHIIIGANGEPTGDVCSGAGDIVAAAGENAAGDVPAVGHHADCPYPEIETAFAELELAHTDMADGHITAADQSAWNHALADYSRKAVKYNPDYQMEDYNFESEGLPDFQLSLGLIIAGTLVACICILVMLYLFGKKDGGWVSLLPVLSMLGAGGTAVGWLVCLNNVNDGIGAPEYVFGSVAIVLGVVAVILTIWFAFFPRSCKAINPVAPGR